MINAFLERLHHQHCRLALLGLGAAACSARSPRMGAVRRSIMFWIVPARRVRHDCRLRELRAARELIPCRHRHNDLHGADVLPVPDGGTRIRSRFYFAAAPADGQGLNPQLQNYWMAIHPPSSTRVCRHDDPVCVLHRGARHRPSRRLDLRARFAAGRCSAGCFSPSALTPRHDLGA